MRPLGNPLQEEISLKKVQFSNRHTCLLQLSCIENMRDFRNSIPSFWLIIITVTHGLALSTAPQFKRHYHQWRGPQLQTSSETCNATLTLYYAFYARYGPLGHLAVDACYNQTNCILEHTPEVWKASMAAASVALGFLPTILSAVGPSISETSLLSSQRPLLAFLVGFGVPATQPSRIFEYEDPIGLLSTSGGRLVIPKLPSLAAGLVSGLEYLAAAAAVANALQNSYQLGISTVSAVSCTIWELPMIWSALSIIVHFVAAISFYIRVGSVRQDCQASRSNTFGQQTLTPDAMPKQPDKSTEILIAPLKSQRGPPQDNAKIQPRMKKTFRQALVQYSKRLRKALLQCSTREFVPCSNRPTPGFRERSTKISRFAVPVAISASLVAYAQLICGTIWLASLLFISAKDATNNVLLRYLMSAFLCRLVLLVELGGMRGIKS